MRISDWSSDVCSSDLIPGFAARGDVPWMSFGVMGGDMQPQGQAQIVINRVDYGLEIQSAGDSPRWHHEGSSQSMGEDSPGLGPNGMLRSAAHTSELQSLMRTSHPVFRFTQHHHTHLLPHAPRTPQ